MLKTKQKRLENAGWVLGDAQDFLQLSDAEAEYVEIKTALASQLAKRRKSLSLTQTQMAKQLKSSQSRVAKMEAADASVSLDLMIRSLLTLGFKRTDLAMLVQSSVVGPG